MIELSKKYTTAELAKEVGVSYQNYREHRERYEDYLSLFYEYEKGVNNRGAITYTFTE